jgi:subtilisin family serine protease
VNNVQSLSGFSNWSRHFVDLAAPGCKLGSWLDADRPGVDESGTSQAAPVVAFAATLLRSLWEGSPARLKNRLLYSGDLLDRKIDREKVRSMSQLSIAKSLTFPWDRVRFRDAGRSRTLLGSLEKVQGLTCDEVGAVNPQKLRAFKRAESGALAIYRTDSNDGLLICWGKGDPATVLTMNAKYELVNGRFEPPSTAGQSIGIDEVEEVVLAY